MRTRSNIQQVSDIAQFESRLIEGLVTKVFPQTRTAMVRLDGSNQQTTVNLGHIDPFLVYNKGSKVLLYRSGQSLYAISAMPGQYAPSSAGVTLGDRWGSTALDVYSSSTYNPFTSGSTYSVASIDSLGNVRYCGDLVPVRDGVEYTGKVVLDGGRETPSGDVTLTDSALDCISKTVTVPRGATLKIRAVFSFGCSALTVAQNISAQIYINASNYTIIPHTLRNSGDWFSANPIYRYTPLGEESVTFKMRAWKSTTSNTVRFEQDYSSMEWEIVG